MEALRAQLAAVDAHQLVVEGGDGACDPAGRKAGSHGAAPSSQRERAPFQQDPGHSSCCPQNRSCVHDPWAHSAHVLSFVIKQLQTNWAHAPPAAFATRHVAIAVDVAIIACKF